LHVQPSRRRVVAVATIAAQQRGRKRQHDHAYGIHGAVNKVLIINREITPGRITVIFVDEALGF
jgi:hypothetical protein